MVCVLPISAWRRCCCFALFVCLLIYAFMDMILDHFYEERHLAEAYFVNSIGCRILAMAPFTSHVVENWSDLPEDKCPGIPLFIDYNDDVNNYLKMNHTMVEELPRFNLNLLNLECKYKEMVRNGDWGNKVIIQKEFLPHPNVTLVFKYDIVYVRCKAGNMTAYSRVHYYLKKPKSGTLITQSTSTKGIPENQFKTSRPQPTPAPTRRLSVLVVGIDSISHMHFLRSMPRTRTILRSLPHVEFWGYHRVGLNSFPNLIPFFSGQSADEVTANCYNKLGFDDCHFIWKDFKNFGYLTAFGEDSTNIGTFNYLRLGFTHQPTDYYLRPAMLAMYAKSLTHFDNGYCNGQLTYAEELWKFLNKLLPQMKVQDFFTFLWWTQGVHDVFNYAKLYDGKFIEMLQQLNASGILEHTMVIFMADHGLRFGTFRQTYQGMVEENQPVLFTCYPKWLEETYPLAMHNLKLNARRLVTTFDLHATLKDILNLDSLSDENVQKRILDLNALGSDIPRGISLFLPIPDERNCTTAEIVENFCTCHSLRKTSTKDSNVQRAARFMVRSINNIIKLQTMCEKVVLDYVLNSYFWSRPNEELVYEIKLSIQTNPGMARFEGTVRFSGYSIAMAGPIQRINKYGNQSYCIQNYLIEMFCYCK
ncbi:uncharacterized protein LOC115631787 [Scaptodrosophila lebanonensis]|uniref:Uncharacterized protein LOC115631787 n=1 Tax=Drosophila lebanonensis TaxID=7225 RepID=A0A6J2UAH4_DROLE|nr:uncharacterized protein LOC115631787 [Scaptodrosophila lebanonensis]